jgi:hypothetical protein
LRARNGGKGHCLKRKWSAAGTLVV